MDYKSLIAGERVYMKSICKGGEAVYKRYKISLLDGDDAICLNLRSGKEEKIKNNMFTQYYPHRHKI